MKVCSTLPRFIIETITDKRFEKSQQGSHIAHNGICANKDSQSQPGVELTGRLYRSKLTISAWRRLVADHMIVSEVDVSREKTSEERA